MEHKQENQARPATGTNNSFDFDSFKGQISTKKRIAPLFRAQVQYKKPRHLLKAVFFKPRYVVIDVHLSKVRIYRDKNELDKKFKPKHEIELGKHKVKLCKEDDQAMCIKIVVNGYKHFLAFDNATLRMQAFASLESAQNSNKGKISPR